MNESNEDPPIGARVEHCSVSIGECANAGDTGSTILGHHHGVNNDGGGGTNTTNSTPIRTFVNDSNEDLPIGARVEHHSVSIGGCANAGDTGSTIPGCRHGVNNDGGGGTNTTNSTPIHTFVNKSNEDPLIGACVKHRSVSIGGCANAGDTGSTIPCHHHGVNDDGGGGTNTTNSTPICTFVNKSNEDLPIGTHVEHCSVYIGGCANAGDTGSTIPGHRHGVNDDGGGGTNTANSTLICTFVNESNKDLPIGACVKHCSVSIASESRKTQLLMDFLSFFYL